MARNVTRDRLLPFPSCVFKFWFGIVAPGRQNIYTENGRGQHFSYDVMCCCAVGYPAAQLCAWPRCSSSQSTMHRLVSLNTSLLLRNAPLILRRPGSTQRILNPLAGRSPAKVHARFAASSVSGRPGSQSVEQATQNVKEEVGNSLTDWARSIAGGVFTVDIVKPKVDSFVSKPCITLALRGTTVPCVIYCNRSESRARSQQGSPRPPLLWAWQVACHTSRLQVRPCILLTRLGKLRWGSPRTSILASPLLFSIKP